MSRGPGKWQLAILHALRRGDRFRLRGATPAETASLRRAVRELETVGRCVVVLMHEGARPPLTFCGLPAGKRRPGRDRGPEGR